MFIYSTLYRHPVGGAGGQLGRPRLSAADSRRPRSGFCSSVLLFFYRRYHETSRSVILLRFRPIRVADVAERRRRRCRAASPSIDPQRALETSRLLSIAPPRPLILALSPLTWRSKLKSPAPLEKLQPADQIRSSLKCVGPRKSTAAVGLLTCACFKGFLHVRGGGGGA